MPGPAEPASGTPGLTVRLEGFEGPLDLLLHLARSSEIDLTRLPVRQITDQYLAHLEAADYRDLEDAGAFLVMAATLIYLKSKLLLPRPDVEEEDLDEEGETLRLELEARLSAYARVKEIGEWLRAAEGAWAARLCRPSAELPMPEYLPLDSVSLWDLTEAYRGFLVRLARTEPTREVEAEPPSLLARMAEILGVLDHSWYVLFSALLGVSAPRPEVIVTLLAVLELARLQRVRAQQRELFSEIVIERALSSPWGGAPPAAPLPDLTRPGVSTANHADPNPAPTPSGALTGGPDS
jgi:segregation and condensation protein A